MTTTPQSIEDLAAMYMAGEPSIVNECYCQEFAHQVLHQAADIKVLKEKLRYYTKEYLKLLEKKI